MFNYGREKKRFDKNWEQLEKRYRDLGMAEKAIAQMRDFDWELFRKERNNKNHTQELPSEVLSDDASTSELFLKYKSLQTSFDESDFSGRFAWVDTIADSLLADKLKSLSDSDLELLTLLVVEGYSQSEIAKKQGCNQSVISRKYKKIKKNFSSMS